MTNRLNDQAGYSLVEVLAAVVILAVAIIPMVGMFDAGLRAASTSGNYDKARSLANLKLEESKSLGYDIVRSSFPDPTCALDPSDADGEDTCSSPPIPAGFPSGFTYSVEKQYLKQPPTAPSSPTESFQESAAETDLIRITVTVTWGASNTYRVTGLVAS